MLRTALAVLFALLPACLDVQGWVGTDEPWTASTLENEDRVRVERLDGTRVVLERPRIERDEQGAFVVGHEGGLARETSIDLESVRSLEVRGTDSGKLAAAIVGGLVVVGAIAIFVVGPFLPSA